jgi:hypothetical protein
LSDHRRRLSGFLLAAAVGTVSLFAAERMPNILIILADDAGYADFGFQGGGIHGDFAALTPNIDSIAGGGTELMSLVPHKGRLYAGVGYPAPDNTPERSSVYFLIRHRDATYEWGRVFDPAVPLPNPAAGGLRATRALRLSPFPEDGGYALFFSGFDAASQTGPVWHNTAWIYKGNLAIPKKGRRKL